MLGQRARSGVSRETRLLLLTVFVSLASLWVLARIRFPETQASSAVAPVLAQLTKTSTFDDLPLRVFQLEAQLARHLVAIDIRNPDGGPEANTSIAALRLNDDTAALLLADDDLRPAGESVIALDPGTGLCIVRVSRDPVPELTTWSLTRPRYPRYFVVSDATREGSVLRPVFVSAMEQDRHPGWVGPIWAVSPAGDLTPGEFVFTTDGLLVGLVVRADRRLAIVPGQTMLNAARLLTRDGSPRQGGLGVEVEPLTAEVGSATGTGAGVVVAWVAPQGPSAGQLMPFDVIEAIGDHDVLTRGDWRATTSRLAPGQDITLRVRRRGESMTETVVAGELDAARDNEPLGLTLREIPGSGVEVVRVDPGSSAARATFEAGDLITVVGEVRRPSPFDVKHAFDSANKTNRILVAVTRGQRHLILVLGKR